MMSKDRARFTTRAGCLVLGLLFSAVLVTAVSAAGSIQTAMGDSVTLSGYSYGSPNAYLFLTGPNLPENGVALNNINSRADQGGFTIVPVDGNNHWTYKWNTANIGGRLDAGSYTIWVVNGPNDRSHLNEAEYSTIQVTLGVPSLSVDTPVPPTGLEVTTTPSGAAVLLEGKFLGSTPLTRNDLSPGIYNLTLVKSGYATIMTPVQLVEGRVTAVDAPLASATAAAALPLVSSSPSLIETPTPAGGTAVPAANPPAPAATPRKSPILPLIPVAAFALAGCAAIISRNRFTG